MKVHKFNNVIYFLLALVTFNSCNKSDFLNERPQKSILTPSSLDDLQALLDMDGMMVGLDGQGLTPQLGESGSDNFYLLDANFNTNLRPQMQNYYIWEAAPYNGVQVLDWEYPYRTILYTNSVLEGLEQISEDGRDDNKINSLRGQALFHRAHMYHQLAQVFAPPYDKDGANDFPGLPLRLSADINEVLSISTVQQIYDLILDDLKVSLPFLSIKNPYKHRPSKQAAYALLARVYMTMHDYPRAKIYADSCLAIQNTLLDYNIVNSSTSQPFRVDGYNSPINTEIIFYCGMLSQISQNYPTNFNYAFVDTTLYNSYHENDLRREVFFEQRPEGHRFKGSYSFINGRTHFFSGLAVDEVLLIRSECSVRLGNIDESLQDLNQLLHARWRDGKFLPYESTNKDEVLETVLKERRKELLFRGLRWSDLRRLNQEGHNISLIRHTNGETFTLLPNDPRWVWPFPPEVTVQ